MVGAERQSGERRKTEKGREDIREGREGEKKRRDTEGQRKMGRERAVCG